MKKDIEQIDSYQDRAIALFILTQTEEKLKKDNIQGKTKADEIYYEVGKKVRESIAELPKDIN